MPSASAPALTSIIDELLMWKHKPNKGFPSELLWTWHLSQQFLNLASVLEWDCFYQRDMGLWNAAARAVEAGMARGMMSCKEARRLRTELGCLSLSKHAFPSLILSPLTLRRHTTCSLSLGLVQSFLSETLDLSLALRLQRSPPGACAGLAMWPC